MYIQSEKTTTLTLMLPMIIDWIDETINESDAVWRLLHQRYGIIWLIQKFY